MKKYLVDVYVPAVSQHFDVFLPVGKNIGEVTVLLVGIIESLTNSSYKGSTKAVLISANNGVPFEPSVTVHEAGIRNSVKLILI